jgi:hypothetical protein
MKDYCTMLYHYLQNEIDQCKQKMLAYDKEVECCFQIAVKYFRKLAEKLREYEFECEENEIEFFKKWKPKFTSEMEYFNLVYHALLFQPIEPDSMITFWEREYKRLEKFKAEQKKFLDCYCKGNRETEFYFLRKNYKAENLFESRIYVDTSITTNGDPLVASLLALERYKGYTDEQLRNLSTNELKDGQS